MSVNPSVTSISSVTATKHTFEKFSKEEVKYLKGRLPEYVTAISQGPTKKGDKGEWVIQNVLPDFKSRFGYSADGDGASVESLSVKLRRWFTNNGKPGATTKVPMARLVKKPRAKNALDLFVEENRDAIVEKARDLAQTEGRKAPGEMLSTWKQARQALFDALDPGSKARYESQATEVNERLNSPPDPKEIYANQARIGSKITDALQSLSGWDWGQCGPLVCFVQAAYRDEQDQLQTINASVSGDIKMKGFPTQFPDYDNFRDHFKRWAAASLPEKPPPTTCVDDIRPLITISLNEGKFPHLDLPEDLEDVTVKMIKNALTDYMTAAWEHARPRGFSTSIPWTSLKSALPKLFANPNQLATFPHLDPVQMLGDEAFRLLRLVSDAQVKDEASPLTFSVALETINALDRGDEIGDSINTPLSLTKTMDPRGRSTTSSEPVSEGSETAIEALLSPTETTRSRALPPATTDHIPSSGPVSEGAGTAIDALRSPTKTTRSRGKNAPPPATTDHTPSSRPVSGGAGTATDASRSPTKTTVPSETHSIGAGKRARAEGNTSDAPRKKGKWADQPTRTSRHIRQDGYANIGIGKRK